MSGNGHRLVLFDIDGTRLSAGAVARDSFLIALERAYDWRAEALAAEGPDELLSDFSDLEKSLVAILG